MSRARRTLRHDLILAIGSTALVVANGLSSVSAQTNPPAPTGPPLDVVATTTILADLIAQAGGSLVSASSLVPKGGEVHTFDPTPEDAIRLSDADLIAMNGLGLDGWLHGLIDTAGATSVPVVELGANLPGVTYLPNAEELGQAPAPSGVTGQPALPNPHLWMNVAYAERYVDRIVEVLSAADPTHAADYAANGAAYRNRLAALDSEIRDQVNTIPPDHRRVISFHDAFPYFAAAYGLQIVGTVLKNPGQEPSAADLAEIIDVVRNEGATAIFAETQFPNDLADTIAQETGITVVNGLYSDTLGDPPAATYEGMMRTNLQLVTDALR
jgi:ABC-type Zn uptake system ZnuABC Zn-binding protein ZnuA